MNVGSGSTSTYTSSIKNELQGLFSTLKSNFRDKGIPVVIGEFGSTDKNNTAERVKWATDYTALARKKTTFHAYCGTTMLLQYTTETTLFSTVNITAT